MAVILKILFVLLELEPLDRDLIGEGGGEGRGVSLFSQFPVASSQFPVAMLDRGSACFHCAG